MADLECFARTALISNGRRVDVRFAKVEERLVCIGLEIGPALVDETFTRVSEADLKPLTAEELRAIPLGRLKDRALEATVLRRSPSGGPIYDDLVAMEQDRAFVQESRAQARPGRPPLYQPAHFEKVARIYREHEAKGGRAPTKAVSTHFKTTKSTAAKWVARARQMGLLERAEGLKSKDEEARDA